VRFQGHAYAVSSRVSPVALLERHLVMFPVYLFLSKHCYVANVAVAPLSLSLFPHSLVVCVCVCVCARARVYGCLRRLALDERVA
jgi:hypothetical protein